MKTTMVRSENNQSVMKKRAVINSLRFLGLLIQVALFAGMWWSAYVPQNPAERMLNQAWGLTVCYLVLFVLMARIYDGVEVGSKGTGEITYSMGMAQAFAVLFQYIIACLMLGTFLRPIPFILLLVCGILVSAAVTRTGVWLYRKLFPPLETYVIYDYLSPEDLVEELKSLSWKFRIIGVLNLADGMERVLDQLDGAEAVILCGVHSTDRNTLLKTCVSCGLQMYIKPKIGDLLLNNAYQMQLLNFPVLHCGRSRTTLIYAGLKRLMDVLLSGIALLVLSPVMAVTALVIHHYDGGPAFYRQTRLTRDGEKFEILKFRSMRVDAEKDGIARLASEGDSRITPVGKVIRACRLDELPQLINILRGDMSIVGPRPERPEIAAQYQEKMPEFGLRLQVKAGLTGYAQVYGKYNTKPYDKLQMDLLYISQQSIWQDIKLIFLTVKVLFMKESTEGVAQNQITAVDAKDVAVPSERKQRVS